MHVWRLCAPRYALSLDGEGARLYGVRWNSPGRPMLYCAASPSLAVLEVFVHLPPESRTKATLPSLVLLRLRVPDEDLAAAVDLDARGEDERRRGDAFLARGESLVARARSVIVPAERNLLLNPRHPRMPQVRIEAVEDFVFDPRMVLG